MNNEMMYALFLNSVRKMNDEELRNALEKASSILSKEDYTKLVEVIQKERNI